MSKQVERRMNAVVGGVKLEARAEGEPQVIVGTGAVYYDGSEGTEYVLWDFGSERCVERMMPGAFDKALERGDDVRALLNHDPNCLLGRTKSGTLKLSADAKGLQYEVTPGDTSVARDVIEHLKRGDISGSSITFVVDEERWTETKAEDGKWHVLREILSVSLADCSPVVYPAYENTSVGLRSEGEPDEAKAALAAHRAKANAGAAARAAVYGMRARAVEVMERE